MENNLIIFELLLPIFFGCGFLLLKSNNYARLLGILVSIIISILALLIFRSALNNGSIIYHFGGWFPPVGIEFKVTKLKAFLGLIFSLVLLITMSQQHRDIPNEKAPTFYGIVLLCFAGFVGAVSTTDFFNMYVFIEIASLTSYSLGSISKNHFSTKFSLDYLIVGTIAATFILIGIGYVYAASGTLNMSDFLTKSENIRTSKLIHIAYYFITIGLCIKAALLPFHTWFVNLYKATNSFILPFFAGISSKAYILILLILNLYIFNFSNTEIVFMILGSAAALIGSILALKKGALREILIFSSIAETGYIFMALGIGGPSGAMIGVLFIVSNIISKVSLFVLNGNIMDSMGSDDKEKLYNLQYVMPITVLLFIANCLSVIGMPATIGFAAKISLMIAAFSKHSWLVICVVLASSLMSLVYNWRIIECFLYPKNMNYRINPVRSFVVEKKYLLSTFLVAGITLTNIVIGIFFKEFTSFLEFLMH